MSFDNDKTLFLDAVAGFAELVEHIPPDGWQRDALGEWDVRALVGHTRRAVTSIERYVETVSDGPLLAGPVEYFRAALIGADPPERREQDRVIAERGRAAADALGPEPTATIAADRLRAGACLRHARAETPVATPFGMMTLTGYLPTRTFELAVHSLDLARALEVPVPEVSRPAISDACRMAGELAGARPDAPEMLLAFTGRDSSVASINVLAARLV